MKATVVSNSAKGVIHQGCWAHARRKFDEAIKTQGKPKKGQPVKTGKAQMGLSYIQKLYRIEKEIKALSLEEKYNIRQERSLKVLNELHCWLEKALPQTPPKTALGQALTYLLNQWDKLVCQVPDDQIAKKGNQPSTT